MYHGFERLFETSAFLSNNSYCLFSFLGTSNCRYLQLKLLLCEIHQVVIHCSIPSIQKKSKAHMSVIYEIEKTNENVWIRTQGTWRKGIQCAHVYSRCSTYGGRTDGMDNFVLSSFFLISSWDAFSTTRMLDLCYYCVGIKYDIFCILFNLLKKY